MPVIEGKVRPGFVMADEFVRQSGFDLVSVQSELDRLRDGQRQRPEDPDSLAGWLLTESGADYRCRLVEYETRLRAEANKQALRARRAADEAAVVAEREAEASLSVEERLERLERALRRQGVDL